MEGEENLTDYEKRYDNRSKILLIDSFNLPVFWTQQFLICGSWGVLNFLALFCDSCANYTKKTGVLNCRNVGIMVL